MNSDIISYYRDRAKEYENIYAKPERQKDLLLIEQFLQSTFRNKGLIEIACGTGYWTQRIAKTAHSIVATDINETVLDVAKSKEYSPATVNFKKADIFNLNEIKQYESLFGGFIWSHVKLQDLKTLIAICNGIVEHKAMIVFIDNNYVEGSSLPITGSDDFGNTYQTRKLDNGTTHKVVKNFPTNDFIKELLADKASNIEFINLPYYWIVKYNVK